MKAQLDSLNKNN